MGIRIICKQDIYRNEEVRCKHQPRQLNLCRKYTPEKYPKYDNYDAIDVEKLADIPCDYNGLMGVPVAFLNYCNAGKFEAVSFALVRKDIPRRAATGKNRGRFWARILVRRTGKGSPYFMPDTE